ALPILTTRYLHTATRCFQAAALLLKEPYGSVPVETLLRSVLIASTKALYVLQPSKRKSREANLWRLYEADRAALDYAEVRELKRSEEHTSELQSRFDLVCRLLLERK